MTYDGDKVIANYYDKVMSRAIVMSQECYFGEGFTKPILVFHHKGGG